MEGAARQDLETRLGNPKKPVPADLTAGVTLSGLTNSHLARTAGLDPIGSRRDFVESPGRLTSQHELAGAYLTDGQVQKAVELLAHVVAVKAMVLREDHPSRLASQDELADWYAQLSVNR